MHQFFLSADPAQMDEELNKTIDTIRSMNPEQLLRSLQAFALDFLPRLLGAVVVLLLGRLAMQALRRVLKKLLKRSRVDSTLHNFLISTVNVVLYILLFVVCLSILRIPFAPLITIMGTAGLALSLALKDSLANVAGGLSVLFSHPFRKGDLIKVKDITGVVRTIDLVYTQLQTDDDKIVYLPNGDVAKSVVVNFSSKPLRRLDFVFFIPLDADFEEARKTILQILTTSEYTLPQPEPIVRILGKTEDSYSISCKVWAREEYYDTIYNPLADEIDRQLKAADM